MALTIRSVDRTRLFEFSEDSPNGLTQYNVMIGGTDNEAENYEAIAAMISASSSIPNLGDQLGNFESYCTDVKMTLHSGQNKFWRVDVTYEQPESVTTDIPDDVAEDPLQETVKYVWGSKVIQETIWEDRNGIPITMSDGTRPTPLPTVDVHVLTCAVSRNTRSYDPFKALSIIGKINAGNFSLNGNAFFAESVKCTNWGATEEEVTVTTGGSTEVVTYTAETLNFEIRDDGWLGQLADVSYTESVVRFVDGFTGKMHKSASDTPNSTEERVVNIPIVRNNRPTNILQFLNGDGRDLAFNPAVAERAINRQAGQEKVGIEHVVVDGVVKVVMLQFDYYEIVSFVGMGFL